MIFEVSFFNLLFGYRDANRGYHILLRHRSRNGEDGVLQQDKVLKELNGQPKSASNRSFSTHCTRPYAPHFAKPNAEAAHLFTGEARV
jgi:hypothetical protein